MLVHTKTGYAPSKIDTLFLVASPLFAIGLTLLVPVNLMVTTLLFFGPQAVYLSWRRPDIVWRTLVYALAIAVISIYTDYMAERDLSWTSTSMFGFRLAGVVPIEAVVWMFLLTYLIVAYYLFFFDSRPHPIIGKRLPWVFLAAGGTMGWLGLVAGGIMRPPTINYFYIKSGLLLFVLPLVVFAVYFPRYLRVFAKTMPYFTALGFANLLVCLHTGQWAYAGQHFIGWVRIGTLRFPAEELVFWIILYCPFLLSQFVLFNDNRLARRIQ